MATTLERRSTNRLRGLRCRACHVLQPADERYVCGECYGPIEPEYDLAAFGISGLETALPLLLGGVDAGWAALDTVIAALTTGPARVLGIDVPDDDWTVVDRAATWIVTAAGLASKGKNTPLLGRELRGRVVMSVVGGDVRYEGDLRAAPLAVR